MTGSLDNVLRQADRAEPGAIAAAMAVGMRPLGVSSVEILLADYRGEHLTALGRKGGESGRVEPVTGSRIGECFASGRIVDDPDGGALCLPIVERGHVMGVLEVMTEGATEAIRAEAVLAATLAGHLIASADRYTDAFKRTRDREGLSLAAELQWAHLPPESFASDQIAIASTVEPAYDIGGDGYDYDVGVETVDFALIDAMGHGLEACLSNLVALTALRSARRAGGSLPEIAAAIGEAVAERGSNVNFVTSVFGRVELATGALTWVNGGHPPPWVVNSSGTIRRLDGDRRPPIGALRDAEVEYPVLSDQLDPGDLFVLMSDGVMDISDPDTSARETVGRVSEIYSRSPSAARIAVRTVAREILDRGQGRLVDDATILMLARPA